MKQHLQSIQTILILVLCIAIAFIMGKLDSQGTREEAPPSAVSSAFTIEQILSFNDRFQKLETQAQAQNQNWQSLVEQFNSLKKDFSRFENLLDKNSSETQQSLKSLAQIKSQLQQLQADFDSLSKQPVPPKKTENLKAPAEKKSVPDSSQQESLENNASRLLETIKPGYFDYLAKNRYDDARFKLINFPKRYKNTHAGQQVTFLLEQIDKKIEEDYKELEKLAEDYMKKGQINDSLRIMRTIPDRFPGKPEIQRRAKKATQRLQEEWKRIGKSAIYNAPADEEIQALIENMGSDDPQEQTEAQKALAEIGRRGIYEIRKATEHENSHIRWRAIVLLGQMGDQESEHIFITGLRDPESQVRFSSLESLQKIKSYNGIDEIIKVADDDDFQIAKKAINVFEKITGHQVTLDRIEINKSNIQNVKEMMLIYWEKNRGKFINS